MDVTSSLGVTVTTLRVIATAMADLVAALDTFNELVRGLVVPTSSMGPLFHRCVALTVAPLSGDHNY